MDMFILIVLLYICLVLLQFRRKLYPGDYPNNGDDNAREDESKDNG